MTVALYNRVCLRCCRLWACRRSPLGWTHGDFADTETIALVFSGSNVRYYQGDPTLEVAGTTKDDFEGVDFNEEVPSYVVNGIWQGCCVRDSTRNEVSEPGDVRGVDEWIWGLSVYYKSVRVNILAGGPEIGCRWIGTRS